MRAFPRAGTTFAAALALAAIGSIAMTDPFICSIRSQARHHIDRLQIIDTKVGTGASPKTGQTHVR